MATVGRVISAPGKVVISGEYAVLTGTVAIVAAVDARARVRAWRGPEGSDPAAPLPPEVVEARRVAEQHLGAVSDLHLALDTQALREGDRKYGLGSSAAAAAAAVGAVMDAHGLSIDAAARRELLQLAHEGHRAVAPKGSGVDVAAASLGGFLRFRSDGAEIAEATPILWPAGLVPALVWTGTPARTSELVAQIDALRGRDPAAHARAIGAVAEAAERFAAALAASNVGEAIAALDAHGLAMGALGRAADAPIVTEALGRAADLARELGGAAKPSGAGGGDIAIALLPSVEAARELLRRAPEAGLTPLDLALGGEGVRVEP